MFASIKNLMENENEKHQPDIYPKIVEYYD